MRGWRLGAIVTWTWLALAGSIAPALGAEPPGPASTRPDRSGILSSDAWRKTMHDFDEWGSVQKMYSPAQIKQYKAKLIDKASRLTGDDLADFMDDLSEKLHILMSAEAKAARTWLSQTLAVASDSYAKEIEAKYPDVAKLSASQLQEQLDEFDARRSSFKQYRSGFDKTRQAQVKADLEDIRRQEDANDRAWDNNGGYSGYSPANSPRQYSRYSRGGVYGGYRW